MHRQRSSSIFFFWCSFRSCSFNPTSNEVVTDSVCKDPWPNSTLSHLTLFGLVTFSTSLQLHSFPVFFTALSFCVRSRLKAQIALITIPFFGECKWNSLRAQIQESVSSNLKSLWVELSLECGEPLWDQKMAPIFEPKCEHPLWVLTVRRRKKDPFWYPVLGSAKSSVCQHAVEYHFLHVLVQY